MMIRFCLLFFLVAATGCAHSSATAEASGDSAAGAQTPSSVPAAAMDADVPLVTRYPASDGSDAVEIDNDTPVSHAEIEGDRSLTAPRPWRAPEYAKQDGALGWTESAFEVPKGLEPNVQFWIDIYSKYTTDQGVLHDADHIDLVYEVVDFTPISSRGDLNGVQKERLKIRRVQEAKMRVIDLLRKFEKISDPSALNDQERKIWDRFARIEGKKKFRDAMSKSRLRFQLGQKDRIIQGIYFSGRYLEDFERIFREAGLPIELTRMVFVESSFNVLARSKVGASGLWQIMRYTGKPYMMINDSIDKRNHPTEATKLAAKLLRNNFKMLQAWPLAVTGYNHGPSGVLNLTKAHKSRELADIGVNSTARRKLGFASRNFYPSFLAVLEVEKNAPKYFGMVQWSQPLGEKDIRLPRAVKYSEILKWFDGDDHKAQIFNPHITSAARKGKFPIPKGAVISVPQSKEPEVIQELASAPESGKKIKKSKSATSGD